MARRIYPVVTRWLSTNKFTSIHCMYGSGRTYTIWLAAGKNRHERPWL